MADVCATSEGLGAVDPCANALVLAAATAYANVAAVPAAAEAGPTPAAMTSKRSAAVSPKPRRTASFSASTAVTIKTRCDEFAWTEVISELSEVIVSSIKSPWCPLLTNDAFRSLFCFSSCLCSFMTDSPCEVLEAQPMPPKNLSYNKLLATLLRVMTYFYISV